MSHLSSPGRRTALVTSLGLLLGIGAASRLPSSVLFAGATTPTAEAARGPATAIFSAG